MRAPDGADSSNSEQSGGSVALEGALSPESNVDGTLKTVDGRVLSAWTSAAELVPFSIVAFIIALAVFYTYVGIQEHRQRKVLTALLKKIKRRKGLQRQFIEIISHYLHTPLTKLSGTMELLSSTNTLSSALREQGARLVSELKSQLDALLAKTEVVTTAQQRVNTVLERVSLPFILRQPVFWLPTVLFVLVTAMIHYAYIYISKSDVLTATILLQLSIGAVALTALVISLYYYNKARFAYNLASAEYAAEDDLYKQQNTFMQSALQQLSERISELKLFESTHAISRLPHAAGFGAGLGEFEVILGKIDRAVGATNKSLHVTDAVSDISQSLDRAVSVISEEVSQKDIQLKLDIPQKMTAHIDTDDLVYALSAILQNAIRFSPNHSEISVKIKRNQSGVEIAVTDSGPGVPESELAGIFKPFHRVEDVHTFNYEGVGLSLFTVKKLVESYSGTVRAERGIASGLRVVVWLPT